MAILENPELTPLAAAGDPDDHRTGSTWSGPLVDPISGEGYVRDLCVLLERIAPGESIPLHRHELDEAIVVESGRVELRLGHETRVVEGRLVAFFPAGVAHGARSRCTRWAVSRSANQRGCRRKRYQHLACDWLHR